MHVDNRYVRCGAIDPAGLLQAEDVTVRARALQPAVAGRVAAMRAMLAGGCPDVSMANESSPLLAIEISPPPCSLVR